MKKWETGKFNDIFIFENGKGITKNKIKDNGNYPVMGANGVIGFTDQFLYNEPVNIIGRVGSSGEVHRSEKSCWVSDNAIVALATDKSDDLFNYYLLKGTNLKQVVIGSTQPLLTQSGLKTLPVKIPPIEEQKKIASFLNMFDEKIAINKKMNETIEKIARTFFKSWFVDFDPVRAKSEGRSIALSKEISDLFPDSYENSEFGKLPKGWTITSLGEILSFLGSGNRPKGGASISEDQIPSIGAENINFLGNYNYTKEKYVPSDFYEKLKKKNISIRDYDILIYKDGANIGRSTMFGKGYPHKECTINEHVHLIRTNQITQKYLYFNLSTKKMQQELISLNTASAQPGINQTQLKTLKILKPDKKVLKRFDEFISPIIDKIFNNCLENKLLEKLKNDILPRLISGKLRLSDISKLDRKISI